MQADWPWCEQQVSVLGDTSATGKEPREQEAGCGFGPKRQRHGGLRSESGVGGLGGVFCEKAARL
jgi:hypothetical protein